MERFDLNGKWRIQSGKYDLMCDVPGSVYENLLKNGLIEDPFYRDNEPKALEVMDEEFVFSREFDYTATSKKTLLVCEGLDTLCDVYLNGKVVAHTDNMHRSYYFDVSQFLVEGKNEIKAVFPPFDAYIKKKLAEDKLTSGSDCTLWGFSHVRKANYMSGWDWGPRLPDAGIWKDIYLIDGTLPRITEVRILQHHEEGEVSLKVTANTSLPADVRVTVIAPNGDTMYATNGDNIVISNPELWWPNGYGKQPLYVVKTESLLDGKIVDTNVKKVGLRTLYISRELDEWGEEFCYKVNGVKIFGMGADYIPEDNILGRLSRERTEKLLKDCIFANFNSLRVWGGGFYPHDYFFELCDELGIIVFMDLMFACSAYPWHEEFLDNVTEEITENLRRIRHHACLGIISGNNEIEEEAGVEGWWRKEEQAGYLLLFEDVIPKIVAKECPEISFVPSSPSARGGFVNPTDENVGDSHYWQVWHGNLPFTEYRKHFFRFLSEFGFQSFPSMKTLEEITLPEDRNPFSAVMELHQRNPAANGKILNYLSQTYLYPTSFDVLVYASQLLQAEAIKYGVEHLRRNRGRCMGTLYWQLNDCWPVASWSSVDSNGRFKALHYEAKRFYEPVHISCVETGEYTKRKDITDERCFGYETKGQIFVNNDTLQDVEGVVEWQLCSKTGEVLQSGSEPLTVKALSYASLEEMDFHKTAMRDNYLAFSYMVGGKVVSSGTVLFTKPKHFHFVDPKITLTVGDGYIDVTADAFAKYVYISNDNDDLVLSDNFFDMGKGTKRVQIVSGEATNLKVKTVFDIK